MKLFLLLSAFLLSGVGEAHDFKVGFYRLARRDHLEIKNVTATSFEFSLGNSSGPVPSLFVRGDESNAVPRLCELEGKAMISGNEATFSGKSEKKDCVVKFVVANSVLTVSGDECDIACNISDLHYDDGTCSEDNLKAKRMEFKALFSKKSYAASVEKMKALIGSCDWALSNPDASMLRSDLALALYKSGNRKGCADELDKAEDFGIKSLKKSLDSTRKLCRKLSH